MQLHNLLLMSLETDLTFTRTEEIIIKEIFTAYQESLLRLYSGESGLFAEDDTKMLGTLLRTPEFQTRISDDFLKFQGFLEQPKTFNQADKDDLVVISFFFYNYLEDLQEKYDGDSLELLLEKLNNYTNAHRRLQPINPN